MSKDDSSKGGISGDTLQALQTPTDGSARLESFATRFEGLPKSDAEDIIDANAKPIAELAHKLYAEANRKLLVVLQGMDTSGKDSTVEAVFARTPPLNIYVAPFKRPTKDELAHDFLWRVHARVPAAGQIAVFNRSHYEDVLVGRVRELAPPDAIAARYGHINAFEKLLADTGTTILKVMLYISPESQAERLRRRLEKPTKRWKFNPGDLDDRALWPQFMEAYQTMLQRTSTPHAPWFVVPADDRPARKAIISQLVRDTLERMAPRYPDPGVRPGDYRIEDTV